MKKLFIGTIILLLFSLSILVIQSSCSKTEAQNSPSTQLNKLLFVTGNGGTTMKLWSANYDGTNVTQVNLALPTGVRVDWNYPGFSIRLSPDGQKIFFRASDINGRSGIYAANSSGSNVVEIIAGDNIPMQYPVLVGAY